MYPCEVSGGCAFSCLLSFSLCVQGHLNRQGLLVPSKLVDTVHIELMGRLSRT